LNPKVLEVLEFAKVRAELADRAASPLGRELAENLEPSGDFAEVAQRIEETDEASKVLRLKGNIPLTANSDIRKPLRRAKIGGMLHADELIAIAGTIRSARSVKSFLQPMAEELPIIRSLLAEMNPPAILERRIFECIDEDANILDSASPELKSIRSQIRQLEARVRERLEELIRSSQKMLSDAVITLRNDRFVIPVKQEYRAHFGGIVHGQSASGQTFFIEPQSVVQLNNQLHETRQREEREIIRILTELSGQVGENEPDLQKIAQSLGRLDFLFAKARYSLSMRGTKPIINSKGYIRLIQARHPFIPKDSVVPNTIEIGKDYNAIVITGPNTGGKTVALKTVGLLILMAQAGLFIPALEDSQVAVFRSVYADIGDEQSIEQSLSTFSSHMVNIVDFLENIDDNSLVLLDELGAGTDPQEGAALAIAILDEVLRRGARIIATTHYPELKAYGYNRKGVVNASVEFDVDTLSPTYRLILGVPGRSNAFEISRRLGLSPAIIARAKEQMSGETNRIDNMIASLEEKRLEAEREAEEARKILDEATRLHGELQSAWAEFQKRKQDLLERARREAEGIVERAKDEAEEIIRELRKMQLEKSAEIKEHELIEAKKRLEGLIPHAETESPSQKQTKKKFSFRPGEEVRVVSLGQKGYLVEKTDRGMWLVQLGIIKMNVEESDLEPAEPEKKAPERMIATVKGKDSPAPIELDLRGERYEDALLRLEKYLDDAILSGYPRVSIIHGKGTGALRNGVREFLKQHPAVKSFRDGHPNEGGLGVTVVEFK